jgi:hypothetical protein
MATVWNANFPLSSTSMCGSVTQITTNWDALEDWWGVEHSKPTEATSGKHVEGQVGTLLRGNTAAISALTNPGTGALAHDTTLGEMQLYRWDATAGSAAWEGLTDRYFSRIRVGMGSQTITASTWTKCTCSTAGVSGTYDGLTEWASYKFTADGPGFYDVIAAVRWPASSNEHNKAVAIYVNGLAYTVKYLFGSTIRQMHVEDIIHLSADDEVEIYVWHDHSESIEIVSATLQISRLS